MYNCHRIIVPRYTPLWILVCACLFFLFRTGHPERAFLSKINIWRHGIMCISRFSHFKQHASKNSKINQSKKQDRYFLSGRIWDMGLSVSFSKFCFSQGLLAFALSHFRPVCESFCLQVHLWSSHPSLGALTDMICKGS